MSVLSELAYYLDLINSYALVVVFDTYSIIFIIAKLPSKPMLYGSILEIRTFPYKSPRPRPQLVVSVPVPAQYHGIASQHFTGTILTGTDPYTGQYPQTEMKS